MRKRARRNVLFIMCDQLRWDYLGASGHPYLETPNIDRLAARGVRFERAYCQSPVCGSSRMSFYTGRYMHSHGVSYNTVPLRVGEVTLGDHLRALGVPSALAGKTHMKADTEGMARLGIDPESPIGVRAAECGFDPFERDDGLYGVGPAGRYDPRTPDYDDYLRRLGYGGSNPWDEWANSAEGDDGEVLSGWFLVNAKYPARVPEPHSETPYMTGRAIDFIAEAGAGPWCLHLSYIKPHWPYIAPAPYHALYGAGQVLPAVRGNAEREAPHPVLGAYMHHRVSEVFSRPGVREAVVPAYMGLVKQIDDQLGRLFDFMDAEGRMDDTLIVFTSDHGDYLGDHWLGEKDFFHEAAVKIPLIVYDPSPQADAARGTACPALVESIDLAPTFLDWYGAEVPGHVLEGRSLLPFLHGRLPAGWRTFAISEYDYSVLMAADELGVSPRETWMVMAVDGRWKYVEVPGFPPLLFDLERDPDELRDLGRDESCDAVRSRMRERILRWALRPAQRTTLSDAALAARRGRSAERGILIGYWDESELPPRIAAFRRGTG